MQRICIIIRVLGGPNSGMRNTIISISDYLRTIRWLFSDGLFTFKKKAILIISGQTVGALMQASAIGLVVQYMRVLESGSSFTIWIFTFDPETIPFVYMTIMILVFFAAAAGILLFARLKRIEIGFDYAKLCSQRVFAVFFRNRFRPRFNKEYDKSTVSRLACSVSLKCGRALRESLGVFRPTVIFIIAVTIMFYTNLILSIILSGVAIASLVFQYRISKDVAKYSVLRDECMPLESRSKKRILSDTEKLPTTMESSSFDANVTERFKKEPTSFYEAFKGWVAGGGKSEFVGNMLIAISVFLILFILGGNVLRTGEGWADVIVYVLALQFAFSELRTLTRVITNMNRFYPQLRRYKIFINRCSKYRNEAKKNAGPIHLDRSSVYSLVMQKGFTLDSFLHKLHFGPESGVSYIGTDFPFNEISFAESLGMRGLNWEDYWTIIRNTDLADLFRKHNPDIINEKRPSTWARIDNRLVFLMMLITFMESQAAYAVVNVNDAKSISRHTWDHIISSMKEKTVIINHGRSLDSIGNYAENRVIFLYDNTFDVFSMDEFENNRSFVTDKLKGLGLPEAAETPADESAELDATEEESEEEDEI